MKHQMKAALLATAAGLFASGEGHAIQISAFSQTSASNTVVATDNGTVTKISIVNAATDVSQLFGNSPFAGVDFNLSAISIDPVTLIGGALLQHYSGSFCISTGAGCTGTDLLSGNFTDAAFGASGGPGLVVNVNNPPDSLTLMSNVISVADLAAPNSFNLGFSNVSPALGVDGTTIAGFGASFAGTVSASAVPVPTSEPATLGLLGAGLLVLFAYRRKFRNTHGYRSAS